MSTLTNEVVLRGHLVIFVDGYKVYDKYLMHHFYDGQNSVSVPDRMVPPPTHDVGSMPWWEVGWAVGASERGRLCMRLGAKPFRKFFNFDEAVAFAYGRQQKFKTQQHILVYVTKTFQGAERMDVVRSADDVTAIHTELDEVIQANEAHRARCRAEHPHIDLLREKFGYSKGWRMSDLLRQIREEGREATIAAMPKSSWYRLRKELREVGLEP
jgi:hypothetical protein